MRFDKMRFSRGTPINQKLTLLMAVASGVALLFSCIAFVTNDLIMLKASKVKQFSALAEVLASNSTAAMSFQQEQAAKELLHSLQKRPSVSYACLYDSRGKVFAEYLPEDSEQPTTPDDFKLQRSGHRFAGDSLEIFSPVDEEEEHYGVLLLRVDLNDLNDQFVRYVGIAAIVMIVSLFVAIVLASRLQRVISDPILELARTAERISEQEDYSIRVSTSSDDEIGMLYRQFNHMLERIEENSSALHSAHLELTTANDQLELRVSQRTHELSDINEKLTGEIEHRKQSARDLAEAQNRLIEASHKAGMAEVATGVLHNVGNVLNSVNVDASLTLRTLRHSKVKDLRSAMDLMEENIANLGEYLQCDKRGKLLPNYLVKVAELLGNEHQKMEERLDTLLKNVDHIKEIVAMQQSHTGVTGVSIIASLTDIMEDAVRINSASLKRHNVEVVRQFEDIPELPINKQSLLQILINLVTNAKHAIYETGRIDGQITLVIRRDESSSDMVIMQVIDNGIGIHPDNLNRIFRHAFTTKEDGHGFGLHSSALAASELGGSLSVQSDGVGQGAEFTLRIKAESSTNSEIASGSTS